MAYKLSRGYDERIDSSIARKIHRFHIGSRIAAITVLSTKHAAGLVGKKKCKFIRQSELICAAINVR